MGWGCVSNRWQKKAKKKRPKLFPQVRYVEGRLWFQFERLNSLRWKMRAFFHFSVSSCISHFLCFLGTLQFFLLCTSVHCSARSVCESLNRGMSAPKICTRDLFWIKSYSNFSGAPILKKGDLPLKKRKKKKEKKKKKSACLGVWTHDLEVQW